MYLFYLSFRWHWHQLLQTPSRKLHPAVLPWHKIKVFWILLMFPNPYFTSPYFILTFTLIFFLASNTNGLREFSILINTYNTLAATNSGVNPFDDLELTSTFNLSTRNFTDFRHPPWAARWSGPRPALSSRHRSPCQTINTRQNDDILGV